MTRLAIITGASRGIGRATAERFANAGWAVFNLSRKPCKVKGVKNFACDLLDSAQLEATLKQIHLSGYGTVTLIHNAATYSQDTYATLDEAKFMEVLRLNVVVPQLINRALIPQMGAGSSVIFVGSLLSEIGTAGSLSYISSKHALAGVMKSTCFDVAEKAIHTCLVAPGFTDTELLREAVGSDPEDMKRITRLVLLKRLAKPEEIAELIFFCSNNPSINGAVLHANLGQLQAD